MSAFGDPGALCSPSTEIDLKKGKAKTCLLGWSGDCPYAGQGQGSLETRLCIRPCQHRSLCFHVLQAESSSATGLANKNLLLSLALRKTCTLFYFDLSK